MIRETITTAKLKASDNKVLCDGYVKTSLGGCVYCPEADVEKWSEMTEAEADALILANNPVDETEPEEVTEV